MRLTFPSPCRCDRSEELEREVDDGERRLQHANEGFRVTLQEALSVHIGGGGGAAGGGSGGGGDGGDESSEKSEAMTAEALLLALRKAYEDHETHLLQRLTNLQRRQWTTLDKARREAAAAETRGKQLPQQMTGGSGGASPAQVDSRSGSSLGGVMRRDSREGGGGGETNRAALAAIAAAGEEAAMSALQAEGRAVLQAYVEEVAQVRWLPPHSARNSLEIGLRRSPPQCLESLLGSFVPSAVPCVASCRRQQSPHALRQQRWQRRGQGCSMR